jgi:hypothetical protein
VRGEGGDLEQPVDDAGGRVDRAAMVTGMMVARQSAETSCGERVW